MITISVTNQYEKLSSPTYLSFMIEKNVAISITSITFMQKIQKKSLNVVNVVQVQSNDYSRKA
jgi:hypothetical protein